MSQHANGVLSIITPRHSISFALLNTQQPVWDIFFFGGGGGGDAFKSILYKFVKNAKVTGCFFLLYTSTIEGEGIGFCGCAYKA